MIKLEVKQAQAVPVPTGTVLVEPPAAAGRTGGRVLTFAVLVMPPETVMVLARIPDGWRCWKRNRDWPSASRAGCFRGVGPSADRDKYDDVFRWPGVSPVRRRGQRVVIRG